MVWRVDCCSLLSCLGGQGLGLERGCLSVAGEKREDRLRSL